MLATGKHKDEKIRCALQHAPTVGEQTRRMVGGAVVDGMKRDFS